MCISLMKFGYQILARVIFSVRTDCVISLLAEAAPMSKEAACEFFEILLEFLVALV